MTDLFGFEQPREPFKDIRSQRPGVAEEKAQLCIKLLRVLQTPPRSLGSASIQKVRSYRAEHKRCLAVLNCKASSRTELQSAINTMRGFE